jgi:acyl carrier protein
MPADDVERIVIAAVLEVARRGSPGLAAVAPHQTLIVELGLSSLDLAELVAVLDADLGADPFAADVVIGDVRTVGDLIQAYRRA